jgi:NADPH-dependent glutamate synthase beta subunit-like oxidoreductase
MVKEKLDDKFYDMSVNLARHDLEVALKRAREECFRVAKQVAQEVAAGETPMDTLRQMDEFVRSQYTYDPRKMAEWEEIMRAFEFSEDVVADEKPRGDGEPL